MTRTVSHLSEIPPSLPNLHFPYGDIDSGAHVGHAHAWLEKCENLEGNHDQKAQRIIYEINSSIRFWNTMTTSRNIYDKALDVCDVWDEREHPGVRFARMGFIAAHSLVVRTHIFPATFADFSTELENMKNPENTNVRSFGAAAWNGMKKSYPTLFEINDRLNNVLSDINSDPSEEDVELQKAGIGLSTTLGVYSRLDGFIHTHRYTGVKEGVDATKSLIDKPISDWLQR
jgi:hypothetical protein